MAPVYISAGQYGCPYCTKVMKQSSDMRRHIQIHTGEKPLVCNYCHNYSTNRKDKLAGHIQSKHPEHFDFYNL